MDGRCGHICLYGQRIDLTCKEQSGGFQQQGQLFVGENNRRTRRDDPGPVVLWHIIQSLPGHDLPCQLLQMPQPFRTFLRVPHAFHDDFPQSGRHAAWRFQCRSLKDLDHLPQLPDLLDRPGQMAGSEPCMQACGDFPGRTKHFLHPSALPCSSVHGRHIHWKHFQVMCFQKSCQLSTVVVAKRHHDKSV